MKGSLGRAVVGVAVALTLYVPAAAAPLTQPAVAEGATVSGTVTDATGAVMARADVTLRSTTSDLTRASVTNARGEYRFANVPPGSYLVVALREGFVTQTKELTVEPAGKPQVDFALSVASFSEEVTVSYTGEHAQTALKMEADVKDIPLSVQSYGNSFIKAVDTKQVDELYTYMTGVNRGGQGAYNFSMRGFTAGEPNNLEMNGMPGLPARQHSPNIANVERIEVLKGPASVLYGLVDPGGLVNIITKKPQAERQNVLDLRTGTFFGAGPGFGDKNAFRGALDLTGPIDDDKKFLYRLIFSYDHAETFRDFVKNEDTFFVPSLSFNFSPGTLLTLEAEYRRIHNSLDQYLVAPQNDIDFLSRVDRTTRYQEPGDFENEEGWAVSAYFTKLFGGDLNWNATWRSVFHDDDRMGYENNRAETNLTVRRRDRHQINKREYHFLDTTLRKIARTGTVEHNLMLGFNGGYEFADFDRPRFNRRALYVDLFNPVYGLYPLNPDPQPGNHRLIDKWRTGVYAQDLVSFSEKWKLLASARWDRESTTQEEIRFNEPTVKNAVSDVVPTVGLVFQPTPRWSLYGNYAESFFPPAVTAVDENGQNNFDPEEGRQIEGGVKATFAGGRADATLAVYHIKKKNVLVSVGGFSEQIGEERSQGVEFDVRIQPVRNWQLLLGYAYTDAEVTEDADPDRMGARLLNTPENSFNLWTRYDIASGGARGLGFGVGLIYRGDRAGSFPSQVVRGDPVPDQPIAQAVLELPGYFRADAGIYYVKDKVELTLRVNNVFDESYYEAAYNLIQVIPGNPREATLSLRFRF